MLSSTTPGRPGPQSGRLAAIRGVLAGWNSGTRDGRDALDRIDQICFGPGPGRLTAIHEVLAGWNSGTTGGRDALERIDQICAGPGTGPGTGWPAAIAPGDLADVLDALDTAAEHLEYRASLTCPDCADSPADLCEDHAADRDRAGAWRALAAALPGNPHAGTVAELNRIAGRGRESLTAGESDGCADALETAICDVELLIMSLEAGR